MEAINRVRNIFEETAIQLNFNLPEVFRERVYALLDEVESDLPRDMVDMSKYCVRVDDMLAESELSEDLKKTIHAIRNKIRMNIVLRQGRAKQWTRLQDGENHEIVDKFKKAICVYLKIPENAPSKNSDEWEHNRNLITSLKLKDIRKWGLFDGTTGKSKLFDSYVDALVAAFNADYEVAEKLELNRSARVFEWNSKKIVRKNVLDVLRKECGLPETPSPKGSEQWKSEREKILSIKNMDFLRWGIIHATHNEWFKNHMDVLISIFDEDYEIAQDMDKRRCGKKLSWRTHEDVVGNVKAVISQELTLPEILPEPLSPEWLKYRQAVLDITQKDFTRLGITASCGGRFFASYKVLLSEVFGDDYGIKGELLVTKPFGGKKKKSNAAQFEDAEKVYISPAQAQFLERRAKRNAARDPELFAREMAARKVYNERLIAALLKSAPSYFYLLDPKYGDAYENLRGVMFTEANPNDPDFPESLKKTKWGEDEIFLTSIESGRKRFYRLRKDILKQVAT